jgi:low temperature requirement protein LtrA
MNLVRLKTLTWVIAAVLMAAAVAPAFAQLGAPAVITVLALAVSFASCTSHALSAVPRECKRLSRGDSSTVPAESSERL